MQKDVTFLAHVVCTHLSIIKLVASFEQFLMQQRRKSCWKISSPFAHLEYNSAHTCQSNKSRQQIAVSSQTINHNLSDCNKTFSFQRYSNTDPTNATVQLKQKRL